MIGDKEFRYRTIEEILDEPNAEIALERKRINYERSRPTIGQIFAKVFIPGSFLLEDNYDIAKLSRKNRFEKIGIYITLETARIFLYQGLYSLLQ